MAPGGEPRGIVAVDKVGNAVRFYDAQTLREVKSIAAPEPCVHELALSHDRTTAFIPLYGDGIYGTNKNPNNKMLVVDLLRGEIRDVLDLGPHLAPHGTATTRDGRFWVACDLSNALLEVDSDARRVVAHYRAPGKGAHFIALLPDETKLYLSNKEGPLGVFDLRRRAFGADIPVGALDVTRGNGSGSEGLALTADGARLLTVDNDRSDLRVIDTATDREIDRVPLVGAPPTNPKRSRLMRLAFSPDGRHLVVTNYASGVAWILDGGDYRQQTLVPLAKGPQGIAFAPGGRTALVANHDSGIITEIDLEAKRATRVHDGGFGVEVLAYF